MPEQGDAERLEADQAAPRPSDQVGEAGRAQLPVQFDLAFGRELEAGPFNRSAMTLMRATVAIFGSWPSSTPQSASELRSINAGFQALASGKGPSSQPPARACSTEMPVPASTR